MSSIPYSILSSLNDDILPILTIEEHQKFCKSLLKSYQSYEKKKSEEKIDRNIYKSEDEFFETQRKQNQEEIFKWFENLSEFQRIKICTIKNKWLINLFIQLYLIYKTYDSCYLKPIIEMEDLFQAQKNFSHGSEESVFTPFNDIYSLKTLKNNDIFQSKDLNFYENYFKIVYKNTNNFCMFNEKEVKKRDVEKNFIDKIKFICLEQDYLDTFTLSRDILIDCSKIKYFLKFFSDDKYFQDWLLPIKVNNIYNFVLPNWMHNNQNLTLFQLIIGYIEQQIILNYEFFYYSKKLYEYSYSNKVIDLYQENEKLVSFVKDNYSYHGNSTTEKKELISRLEIRDIIKDVKNNEEYQNKIKNIKKIYYYVFNDIYNFENKNCILNKDCEKQIYLDLYDEMIKEREFGVMKIIEHITFMNFFDVINCRDNIFFILRKKIVDYQCEKILNELISKDFLSGSSNNKKNKNKKKKKKNKNKENNNNEEIKNKDNNSNEKGQNILEKNIKMIKDNNIEKEKNIKEINEFNIYENQNTENRKICNENEIKINNRNLIKEDIKIVNIKEESINENNNLFNEFDKKDLNYLNSDNFPKNKIETIFNNDNNKEIEKKEEMISPKKKKSKNKEFFLFPLKNKKKNKNNKNICSLNAKKRTDIKNSNLKEDKKLNSPYNKDLKGKDNKISVFELKLEKDQKNYENNNNIKSASLLSSQNKYLENDKNINDSFENNNLSISQEISTKNKSKNNILQIQTSMNITFEKKINKIENNSNNNISNNIKVSNNISNMNNIDNIDNIENINNTNNIDNINNIKNSEKTNNIDKYNNNDFINNNSNVPIISNIQTPYTPSEKFFETLTKEISNYNFITNKNVTSLRTIRLKYLSELEDSIKKRLESKYDIKFEHYGSNFTNLSIESSDLDILINYKPKNIEKNNDFYDDLLFLLNQNEKFVFINPIMTATVPVIKLQIDIKNEINDMKISPMPYFEDDNEFQKINFDLTFSQNEKDYHHSNQIVSYINQSLISYPIIKSLLLILKRYFKTMKMNKSFLGGLSSYSLYLLIYAFCKKFPLVILSPGKALYYFLAFFSMFEFEKYGIDVENNNIYYYLNNNYNYNNIFNNEEENSKKEINIIDPLSKLNVAKSSFKVDEIQNTFRSAYDFLRTEGCYYDYNVLLNKTGYENNFYENIKTKYDMENNDFKIIKRLFGLNKKHYFFDFFYH